MLLPPSLSFDWKISEVGIWLVHNKFKKYVSNFKAQGIDGTELFELVEEDIPGRVGVTNKAHMKKLWNAVKKLKYTQAEKDAKKEAKKAGGKKKKKQGEWMVGSGWEGLLSACRGSND